MSFQKTLARTLLAASLLTAGASFDAVAQSEPPIDKRRENLMVVVRESIGSNKQEEAPVATGKAKATLADGREIELEMAWWELIGDTHIRFVFDAPQSMMGATPQELADLNLSNVQDALNVAVKNVKRVYGEPTATPWTGGISQVQGKSEDLDSSYFLDRDFWKALLKTNPDGLIVAVPSRGGLLYTPLSNTQAVEGLKRGIAKLHASSDRMRVSSALYLFKNDKWSVFQAAVKQ